MIIVSTHAQVSRALAFPVRTGLTPVPLYPAVLSHPRMRRIFALLYHLLHDRTEPRPVPRIVG